MRTKKKKKKVNLFLDSGAFSAYSQGKEINLDEYISFIKKEKKYIDVYANLDVLGDAEKSLENQKIMEEAGLSPIPCYHLDDPFSYLKYYVKNYSYMAIGGMASGRLPRKSLFPNLDKCWTFICDTPKRLPRAKVHGFAMTSLRLMIRYPWYSVDSTSWVATARFGSIYVPRYKKGRFIYDEQSWKVTVSNRSPEKKKIGGTHIDTFPDQQKKVIINYIEDKGFRLGKSEFRMEKSDYELKENEKWVGKAIKGAEEREVEKIIESGVCNNYKLRDEMNIIYFQDLEKALPKYPWSFLIAKQTQKGFGL